MGTAGAGRSIRARPAGRRTGTRARRSWRLLVPVVCLSAGFGFAASAHDAAGTDLRPPGTADLRDLVRSAEVRVRLGVADLSGLQTRLGAITGSAGTADRAVAAVQARVAALDFADGASALHGPGVVVVLDDAPETSATRGVDPNQLVVHQGDLRAVVNAMWSGGADALAINGSRLVATSAVRCVGSTLLLNGQVYSPPYRVAAIGSSRTMNAALAASPAVGQFRQAAGYWGLGYTVETTDDVDVPAATAGQAPRGGLDLRYAHVPTP